MNAIGRLLDWVCSLFDRKMTHFRDGTLVTEEEMNRRGWRWDGTYWVPVLLLALILAGCCGGTIDRFSWCQSGYDRWARECRASGLEPSFGPVASSAAGGRDVYRCAYYDGAVQSWRTP